MFLKEDYVKEIICLLSYLFYARIRPLAFSVMQRIKEIQRGYVFHVLALRYLTFYLLMIVFSFVRRSP